MANVGIDLGGLRNSLAGAAFSGFAGGLVRHGTTAKVSKVNKAAHTKVSKPDIRAAKPKISKNV
ncbi:MAG: hypothetical protein AB7P02_21225 [Alphaproteobacteria bacterium]